MDAEAGRPSIDGLAPMIDVPTLAAYLGVPVATVYDWRTRRLGPPAYRFGKRLMFAVDDVRAWVDLQRDPSPRPSRSMPGTEWS